MRSNVDISPGGEFYAFEDRSVSLALPQLYSGTKIARKRC